jgi:hypothetical protein
MSSNGHIAKNGNGRITRLTPKKGWEQVACAEMSKGSTVTEAARVAGVSRVTLYAHLQSDAAFRKAFEDAEEQGTDVIEASVTRRAVEGTEEPVIYQGKVSFVGIDKDGNPCDPLSPVAVKNVPLTVRRPSDVLAIFLLKGRRPAKFRDNVDVTTNGKAIQPVAVLRGVSMDDL